MKYLQDYMNERQTKAFDEAGAFFAFSNEQFESARIKGIKYVSAGMGLICPEDKLEKLIENLNTIYKESIQQDIKENGIENIIKRELNNHEAYYTGEIDQTYDALKDYGITKENIFKIFKNKNYKIK